MIFFCSTDSRNPKHQKNASREFAKDGPSTPKTPVDFEGPMQFRPVVSDYPARTTILTQISNSEVPARLLTTRLNRCLDVWDRQAV